MFNLHPQQCIFFYVGGVHAHLWTADPSTCGILSVLIDEHAANHEDLLATWMNMAMELFSFRLAYERYILRFELM